MLFLSLSIMVLNVIAFLIPKKMTRLEMYVTSLFAALLQYVADYLLDFKYELYGYFDPGVDALAMLVVVGVYPAANVIILNFFPYGKSLKKKALYILLWSTFLPLYEFAAEKSSYFYYSGWNIWYSVLCYPVILIVLAANLALIRRLRAAELASDRFC